MMGRDRVTTRFGPSRSVDAVANPDRRALLRRGAHFFGPAVAESAQHAIQPTFMRRPDRPGPRQKMTRMPAPPPAAVIATTRLGYGPRPGDIAAFNALGGTETARLTAWLDQQLDPASIDDSVADARMSAAGFTTLGKSLPQLWNDHHVVEPEWEIRIQPFLETERATLLRAVYSRRQLFEVMVDFWHNHFSIFAYEFIIAPVWAWQDREIIRANALGNFRQMLGGVAKSPPMLYYLDNRVSSADFPNENYARELIELHTVGADAYFGAIDQAAVPTDSNGTPLGYVDADVTAAARCLTGWTISDRSWDPDFGNTGEFLYHAPWHDNDPKTVLGIDLPANQAALKDGEDLLDALAAHPATGRFVAGKLARRILGDFPPSEVVEAAADVFTAAVAAPDQIAQTLRTIVLHPSFLSTWGDKVKRPLETLTSAMRGGEADWDFAIGADDTNTLLWRFNQAGQPLFSWHPPNGYPDVKFAWNSTAPLVMSWKVINWLTDVRDPSENYRIDPLSATPPDVRSAEALATFWIQRILGRPMPGPEHDEIVSFMAQGHNPNLDLPLDTSESTQERLRAMVGLIFMSPAFLWR